MNTRILFAAVLGSSLTAFAHLDPITAPAKGATIRPGQVLRINWGVGFAHGTQDLAYSLDGSTWTTFTTAEGLEKNRKSYDWTVPADIKPSTTARIRVCQRSNDKCTDNPLHNVSNLSAPQLNAYTAVSETFTIAASTGVETPFSAFPGARVELNQTANSVELAFDIDQPERVTLKAFDTQGKLLAVLLDARKAAGRHTLSVFSNGLDISKPIIFRLQAGNKDLQKVLGITP